MVASQHLYLYLTKLREDMTDRFSAVTLVNAGAEKVGGRGGGRPEMAQAGGNNVDGADDALAAIKAAIG